MRLTASPWLKQMAPPSLSTRQDKLSEVNLFLDCVHKMFLVSHWWVKQDSYEFYVDSFKIKLNCKCDSEQICEIKWQSILYSNLELKVACFQISVTITPNSGETFKGFLLKVVQQGQTDAVGSFDATAATVQARCGVGSFKFNLLFAESHVFVISQDLKTNLWLYFYRPQTKFAKVMFLHLSVILFTRGVSVCPGGISIPGGLCPQGVSVQGGSLSWRPPGMVTSGRSASYWNAFLLNLELLFAWINH